MYFTIWHVIVDIWQSRLNELLSQMRMQSQSLPALSLDQSQLDDSMLKEIKDVSSLALTVLKAIILYIP